MNNVEKILFIKVDIQILIEIDTVDTNRFRIHLTDCKTTSGEIKSTNTSISFRTYCYFFGFENFIALGRLFKFIWVYAQLMYYELEVLVMDF